MKEAVTDLMPIIVPLAVWGLVLLIGRLTAFLKLVVYAYRIRIGRMQMNEWLELVGQHLDRGYEDGKPYSRHAVKKFLAECSVYYFRDVINKKRK